jgi:hypothetical protein
MNVVKLIVLVGLAAVVAIVAIVMIVGARLPREHRASRTLRVSRAPADVWPVVTRLAGASSVPVDILESQPPHRLVTRIKATERQFGGTWTVAIAGQAAPPASTVTITEDGWVANPIFRFMSRYVIGHHATMDALLTGVAKEFGTSPELTGS